MSALKIWEFDDNGGIEIIPESWVNIHHQVQWHFNAAKYIKKSKMPKQNWKFYNVKPYISKTYESYESAEKALKKIMESSKTDIETDDLITDTDTHNQKRFRNTSDKRYCTEMLASDNNCSTDSDASAYDPLKAISVNVVQEIPVSDPIIETPISSLYENIIFEDNEIDTTIICENNNPNDKLCMVPIEFLNNLMGIVQNTKKDIEFIKLKMEQMEKLVSNNNNTLLSPLNLSPNEGYYKFKTLLPCKDIEELKSLDNLLETDEAKNDFINYLKSKIINNQNLKQVTGIYIETVYSLELQRHVNYIGANGKMPLKNLVSTQVVTKALAETACDLKESENRAEAIKSALIEFRYQMQHTCDRIKALEKKTLPKQSVRHKGNINKEILKIDEHKDKR